MSQINKTGNDKSQARKTNSLAQKTAATTTVMISIQIGSVLNFVYLHAWDTGSQARLGIERWITFYNHQRPHTAHGGQPPAVVYFTATQTDQQVQAVA